MTRASLPAAALLLAAALRLGSAPASAAGGAEPSNLPELTVRAAADAPSRAPARLRKDGAWLVWLAAARLDLPPPPRVELVIAGRAPRDAAEAAANDLPFAPYWAAGVAEPARGRITIFAERTGSASPEDLPGVVLHEGAHLVLRAALPPGTRLPRWYDEGTALLVERDLSLRDAFELARISFGGDPPPLAALADNWPRTGAGSRAAYAQALSFVSHAQRVARPGATRRLVEALQAGAGFERAFTIAYGIDPALLERDWRAGLRREYGALPLVAAGLAANAVFGLLGAVAVVAARRKRRAALARMPEPPEPAEPSDPENEAADVTQGADEEPPR